MSCGIYKITSPTNKVYIGSSKNIEKRWRDYNILSCKSQVKLYNSLKKYGPEAHTFEVIEECDFTELYKRERFYGELFECLSRNGLNAILPGHDDIKAKFSEEKKDKMSLIAKSLMLKRSNEHKEKLSKYINSDENKKRLRAIAKNQSEETRNKIREKLKGKKRPSISLALKGKKRPLEVSEKIRLSSIGKKMSIEAKRKMSENSTTSKIIINISNGVFYSSIREAAESMNLGYSRLRGKICGAFKNDTPFIYA